MKSHSSSAHHPAAPQTVTVKVIPDDISFRVGGPSSANDELATPRRERAVDPLWMIAVAMAFMFLLLAVFAAVD